MLDSVRNI